MQTDRHTNQRTYKLTDIQISSVSVQFQTPTEQHLSKMGPRKDKSKEKPQTKTIKCPYYDMVKSVSKFTLTKFVKNQTALVINVTKGIQILANLVKAVHITKITSACILM